MKTDIASKLNKASQKAKCATPSCPWQFAGRGHAADCPHHPTALILSSNANYGKRTPLKGALTRTLEAERAAKRRRTPGILSEILEMERKAPPGVFDEDIDAAADDLGVDPRSIIRWLAGLDVRGRVGLRIGAYMRGHGFTPNAGRPASPAGGAYAKYVK